MYSCVVVQEQHGVHGVSVSGGAETRQASKVGDIRLKRREQKSAESRERERERETERQTDRQTDRQDRDRELYTHTHNRARAHLHNPPALSRYVNEHVHASL